MKAIYTIEGRPVWQNGKTRVLSTPAGSVCPFQRQTLKDGQWVNSYPGDIKGTIAKVEKAVKS